MQNDKYRQRIHKMFIVIFLALLVCLCDRCNAQTGPVNRSGCLPNTKVTGPANAPYLRSDNCGIQYGSVPYLNSTNVMVENSSLFFDGTCLWLNGVQLCPGGGGGFTCPQLYQCGFIDSNQLNQRFWALRGNSGTNSGINFIGTVDARGLNIKVNNISAIYIDSALTGNYNIQIGGNVFGFTGGAFFDEQNGVWANLTGTSDNIFQSGTNGFGSLQLNTSTNISNLLLFNQNGFNVTIQSGLGSFNASSIEGAMTYGQENTGGGIRASALLNNPSDTGIVEKINGTPHAWDHPHTPPVPGNAWMAVSATQTEWLPVGRPLIYNGISADPCAGTVSVLANQYSFISNTVCSAGTISLPASANTNDVIEVVFVNPITTLQILNYNNTTLSTTTLALQHFRFMYGGVGTGWR